MRSTTLTSAELDFLHATFDLAREGRSAELALAIDAGVPANLTNGAGDSLLILASYHCQPAAVELLLERGADTERVNDHGQTALGAATFRRHTPIMAMLLAAGADPDAGVRSARQIADFFDLTELAGLLADPTAPVEQN